MCMCMCTPPAYLMAVDGPSAQIRREGSYFVVVEVEGGWWVAGNIDSMY